MEKVKLNNGIMMPNVGIFDFLLSDDMAQIAKLNNGKRRYTRTDEALRGFASWKPQYEK